MAFQVQYVQITSDMSTSQFVTMEHPPISFDNVALDIIGGTAQFRGDATAPSGLPDFAVDSTDAGAHWRVKWNSSSYALSYQNIAVGDSLRIIYDKSY